MSPIAAGSAIGSAAVTIGRGLLGAASGGLSFAAELAKAASGIPDSLTIATDTKAAHLTRLDQRLEQMRQRILRHLAEHGIRLEAPVQLISDGLGGIDIAGHHPQSAAIEEALASDILLERDFNQLLSDNHDSTEGSGQPREGLISITLPVAN